MCFSLFQEGLFDTPAQDNKAEELLPMKPERLDTEIVRIVFVSFRL